MNSLSHKHSSPQDSNRPGAEWTALLEAVPEAIVMFDSAGKITFANVRAEELFSCGRDELIGNGAESLCSPPSAKSCFEEIQRHFAGPRPAAAGEAAELCCVRKGGSVFTAEATFNRLETAEPSVICAIRDVSARKRLEAELQEKSAALDLAGQELQAFSHSISHDLRAPLRAMGSFASLLKKSLGAEISGESEQTVKRIQDNVSKMSRLIDGLLDYSSLSWLALTKKKIRPAESARGAYAELSGLAPERRVDLKIAELPECEADAVLLRRVFTNLLSNALKFTRDRDPAVIQVGCRKESGEDVYFVQDNGAGFDMEYSAKLFRVFQRLHSPAEFEGTGVGLAIVQRIVQRHGGRVWAEGKVDEGAVFCFTLGDSGHGNTA